MFVLRQASRSRAVSMLLQSFSKSAPVCTHQGQPQHRGVISCQRVPTPAAAAAFVGAQLLGRPVAARSFTTASELIKDGVAPTLQQRQSSPAQHVRAAASGVWYSVQEEDAHVGEVDFSPELTNTVKLMGNVGKEVDIRYLETGNKVANFSIALRAGKDKDGNDKTDWFDIEVWGNLAQRAADAIHKGSKVAVTGRLRVSSYTDRNGMLRKSVRVVANSINIVRPPSGMQPMSYGDTDQQQQQQGNGQAMTSYRQPQQQQQAVPTGANDGWGRDDSTTGPQPRELADPSNPADAKWLRYFDTRTEWYDNRETKTNPRGPDFKHKKDNEALWLNSNDTPEWVTAQLQLGEDIPF